MKIGNYAKSGAIYYGYYTGATSLFMGLLVLSIGIYIAFIHKFKRTHFTQATIIDEVTCEKESNKDGTKYNCNFVIQYKHNGKSYENNHHIKSGKRYNPNDKVRIRYNPNDPNSFDSFPINPKYIGFGSSILGLLCILTAIMCLNYPMICGGMAIARNVSSALNPRQSK